MVHLNPDESNSSPGIRQVEFNTIASSFGGLAAKVSRLHEYLCKSGAYPKEADKVVSLSSLPHNSSIEGLASGLAAAHKAYGGGRTSLPKCVIFIVQDPERNTFDQRHIEYNLEAQDVVVFRLPFVRVLDDTALDSERALIYTPPAFPERKYEVSTVYYRSGYSPDEYEDSPETTSNPPKATWEARLHIERSAAIKCPTVLTHLAGCKKVQQILATPGSPHMSLFLKDKQIEERVRRTFAPIYPMDETPAGQEARSLALDKQSASRFVLKPQREGGGNNIYRSKIPDFLQSQDKKTWPQYVLMEMIEPPPQRNVILRNGELLEGGVICELGSYGTVLWRGTEILHNEQAGTLLRTKGDSSEEGGVAAGFGAVDSCCLLDL